MKTRIYLEWCNTPCIGVYIGHFGKLGFLGVGSMSRAYSYKWRLAKDWEQPNKRAMMAIITQSDKTLLIKA